MVEKASDVSVIIPAYGTCPYLPQVLKAVLAQSLQPREIIVVHSGPADPSESLRRSDERVRVIHREERIVAGGARICQVGKYRGFEHAELRTASMTRQTGSVGRQ